MMDILLETVRASVLLCLTAFLWHVGRDRFESARLGWNLILGGFILLLFGSILDVTDNFENLNRFVVIGDTDTESFLEKFVGFLGGFVLLAFGLVRWIPSVQRLQCELEERVDEKTRALVETEDRLRESEKLNALGQLAGGVAHDFNNILMIISGYTGRALKHPEMPEAGRDALDQVVDAADRAATLTNQMLIFSRRQPLQNKVLAVSRVLGELDVLLRPLLGEMIDLEIETGEGAACIQADSAHLSQALLNLAINARDAMPRGGKIAISTDVVEAGEQLLSRNPNLAPGSYVRIVITDDGTGMDAETTARIFEPFFTTKELGKGTGLGLATVYGLIQQLEGEIEVDSELGRGTTFTIYLPFVDKQPDTISATDREVLSGNGETILLAEDDDSLRDLVRTMLEELGYVVLTASDGFEALEVESEHEQPIDLLVSDVVMPNLGGIELSNAVKEARPEIKVILLSGYPCRATATQADVPDDLPLLQKPVAPETLARAVQDALAQ